MPSIVKDILTDNNFIGAILSALGFILIGFFLRKKNIITNDGKNALKAIVLKVSLPMMAFSAFMTDFSANEFQNNIGIFILTLVIYLLMLLVGYIFFIKKPKEDRGVLSIFTSIGQLTFFSIPILTAVYSEDSVMMSANMMTLSFRLILYIYCFFVIARLSFNNDSIKKSIKTLLLNPIMITMFIGMFVWLSQTFMPTVDINGVSYSILRIDKTIPSLYIFISACVKLTTPLAMIIIGCILGEAKFLEAFKDKIAWVCSILKTIIMPIVVLGIIVLLQILNIMSFNEYEVAVLVIGFAAPLSAVVSTYCSTYNNNAQLASRVCLLSTLICVVTFPILFVIVKLTISLPIF